MITIEAFKNKLGALADNYSEEELIKMKNDMDGLVDLLFDDYFNTLKNKLKP